MSIDAVSNNGYDGFEQDVNFEEVEWEGRKVRFSDGKDRSIIICAKQKIGVEGSVERKGKEDNDSEKYEGDISVYYRYQSDNDKVQGRIKAQANSKGDVRVETKYEHEF